jgi:hypothetical protein
MKVRADRNGGLSPGSGQSGETRAEPARSNSGQAPILTAFNTRPFHRLRALAAEKGRPFDGLFIPVAEGLAIDDVLDAARAIERAIDAHHPKFAQGPFTLTQQEIAALRDALAAVKAMAE